MKYYLVEYTFRVKVRAEGKTVAEIKARDKVLTKLKDVVESGNLPVGFAYTKADVLTRWKSYDYYGN